MTVDGVEREAGLVRLPPRGAAAQHAEAYSSCPGPRQSGWSGWEGRQTWHEGETWAQEGTPFLLLPSPGAKGTLMKGVESHPPHGF